MVVDYDYPFERHYYETSDGYINCLHRISGPRGTSAEANAQAKVKKPVMLYQHGLLDSSAGICCNGTELSTAYFFADSGFDVWMNNSRGNKFSRAHVYLDPDHDKKYWDFSFQHMAAHDLPAAITTVLGKTGVKSLSYIGHS